jgi:hypothetical protein
LVSATNPLTCASYHNIKTEETAVPNFNQRKAVLQDYLSKHNIPFQPLETKKQIYARSFLGDNPHL